MPAELCIWSDYSDNNKALRDTVIRNRCCYCCKHGYDLVEDKKQYSANINVARLKDLLSQYEFVVSMDYDILIQRPEMAIHDMAVGPHVLYKTSENKYEFQPARTGEIPLLSGGTSSFQDNIINGGFIVWHRSLLDSPWVLDKFMHNDVLKQAAPGVPLFNTQDYITYLFMLGVKVVGVIPKQQIAPRCCNGHRDYSGIDEGSYFSLHFHVPQRGFSPAEKVKVISKYLEEHPELSNF